MPLQRLKMGIRAPLPNSYRGWVWNRMGMKCYTTDAPENRCV